MTDSSDGESVGSDCGRIGRGRRRACDDFFFCGYNLRFSDSRYNTWNYIP